MMSNTETYSTSQASELADVHPKTLLGWVADGLLDPQSKGKGKGKRYIFSEEDVKQARALKKPTLQPQDALLLADLVPLIRKARARAAVASPTQVVVISTQGVRVLEGHDSLAELRRRCVGPILLVPPSGVDTLH